MDADAKTPTKNLISICSSIVQQSSVICTPPSRVKKMKNPFEIVLRERLGTNFCSPSLFVKSAPKENQFKWTIDELSMLQPVEIDDSETNQQFESPQVDALVQSRIHSYFSMKEILPSPKQPCIPTPLIKPSDEDKHTCTKDSTTQTELSLPPKLPAELEEALKPYFTYSQVQQDVQEHCDNNEKQKQLYNKLFGDENQFHSDEEVEHVEQPRQLIPFVDMSPMANMANSTNTRTFGTPGNEEAINFCDLSPISLGHNKQGTAERMRAMDMDSFDQTPNTSANWEMEFKQISLPMIQDNTTSEAMDVSLSQTPKHRNTNSLRKKLSASFGQSDDEDDIEIISMPSRLEDSAYQTGITSLIYDKVTPTEDNSEIWKFQDAVSSTPTKRNKDLRASMPN